MPAAAPFGRWRIRLRDSGAAAWILRDDASYDDRAAPRRASWFEDATYRARDAVGLGGVDDSLNPSSSIRRRGTVSVLAATGVAGIVPVAAQWQAPGAASSGPARYSGQFAGDRVCDSAVVEATGPETGRLVPCNAAGRLFRVSGTSVAAALHAGRLAARMAGHDQGRNASASPIARNV